MYPNISPAFQPDTLAESLLTILALSGEIPSELVSRFSESSSYCEFTVKRLKRDGLIRTFYRDGLRGLRLTAKAKRLLLSAYPDQFESYLTGSSETNLLKSEITRRLRLHRMAEVLLTMHHAGVSSLPWEKPAIFQPCPLQPPPYICQPTYYSSREVKEIGPQSNKIRGSRSTGVLLTDGGIFIVYNTADTEMRWEYRAEMRLKALLQMELCQSRLSGQYRDAPQSAVVFGADMASMSWLMGIDSKASRGYFVLDGNFEHFYYLTCDRRGEVLLQLLCDTTQQDTLNAILLENLSAARSGWPVEHDGFDEDGMPVLFGYTCDMPRIKRFDTALALHEQQGTLVCFDYQQETLRRICGSRVSLQCIDFTAYTENVFQKSRR